MNIFKLLKKWKYVLNYDSVECPKVKGLTNRIKLAGFLESAENTPIPANMDVPTENNFIIACVSTVRKTQKPLQVETIDHKNYYVILDNVDGQVMECALPVDDFSKTYWGVDACFCIDLRGDGYIRKTPNDEWEKVGPTLEQEQKHPSVTMEGDDIVLHVDGVTYTQSMKSFMDACNDGG